MANSCKSTWTTGVLKLVIVLAVLTCCCRGVLGEIEKKVQLNNRIVPTEYVATGPPMPKENATASSTTTTEGPQEEPNPSDWTPVIILVLFLFGAATVGIPSIISHRMSAQRQVKIVPKQRKYTVSLTLADPSEANGFSRL